MKTPSTNSIYYCEGKPCEHKDTCERWIGHYDEGFQYFGKIKTCRDKEQFIQLKEIKEIKEDEH